MALPHRALFRPKMQQDYVAVKRIPVGSGTYIEPETILHYGEFPVWRLRNWWMRGLIGVDQDAWSEWQLERFRARIANDAKKAELAAETPREVAADLGAEVPKSFLTEQGEKKSLEDLISYASAELELTAEDWEALPVETQEEYQILALQSLKWTPDRSHDGSV